MSHGTTRLAAGRLSELAEGHLTVLRTADGDEIGVGCWEGRPFAIRNVCPHRRGPVGRGLMCRTLVAGEEPEPGRMEISDGVVICPWHRWEFDLLTGRGLRSPTHRVKTYPVTVEDDVVFVETAPRPAAPAEERA